MTDRERHGLVIVFLMVLGMAIFETIGIASIMPFLALLSNPGAIESNAILQWAYAAFEFESTNSFLFFVGLGVLALLLTSLGFRAATLWVQLRFAHRCIHIFSCRAVHSYLNRPYEWYLGSHSADISASVLDEVNRVVHNVLFPALLVISNATVALFLVALIVAVDPLLALVAFLVLGGAYFALYAFVRKFLSSIGAARRKANAARFKTIQEAFGGIKDVKIAQLENTVFREFFKLSHQVTRDNARAKVVGGMPTFAMQGLVFGGMLGATLYLLFRFESLDGALPILGLYAFAAYRLTPALQGVYQNLADMRFNMPVLTRMMKDLAPIDHSWSPEKSLDDSGRNPKAPHEHALPGSEISLDSVTFRYPGASKNSLQGASLSISAHTTVALVGKTGSGKTTIVDIIMGLLTPTDGQVKVDGVPISQIGSSVWQRCIGYVPQHIFLASTTVANNIAFGVPDHLIDEDALIQAARMANIHDFVTQELPDSYRTEVGERGVRLSGGQRQRIGIARALYRNPSVLIFDEATSALDGETESAIIDAVRQLGRQKTIVMIAHRLSTVRDCDNIFVIEDGAVVASGKYGDLVESNATFIRMAGPHA